jgi:diphosphomevalonate decarboxylase
MGPDVQKFVPGNSVETNLNLIEASAPSNIALIKYMGKASGGPPSEAKGSVNIPTNASLSYTLNHLRTFVQLEKRGEAYQEGGLDKDEWKPCSGPEFFPFSMSARGQKKFLDHFSFLRKTWTHSQLREPYFQISSANNFPADSGIASSASSFAALTLAAWKVFKNQAAFQGAAQTAGEDSLGKNPSDGEVKTYLSQLSQRGSGSSCRSFFSPWALWKSEGAVGIELPYKSLLHSVIVPDSSPKKVSSSEAHSRVLLSPRFAGRPERAEARLKELLSTLENQAWRRSFEICWDEFMDMHELFATSPEPFDYRSEASYSILNSLQDIWKVRGDGPLVTMDAGSSVHALWRSDQMSLAQEVHQEQSLKFKVWSSF